ncbi:hypothetical protein BH10BAC3_BH10BAC3_14890 [soil metagenome]
MAKFTPIKTLAICLVFLVCLTACSKKDGIQDEILLVRGNAETEASATPSVAFGTIYGGYSSLYKKLAFNINWADLSSEPTGSSFYFANGLLAGRLVKTFQVTEGSKKGLTAGDMILSDEQAAELLNGNWYYTVNTLNFPDGEIRGKVEVVKTQ